MDTKIYCPYCNKEINVEEAIVHRLEDKFKSESDKKTIEFMKKEEDLNKQKELLEKREKEQHELMQEEINKKMKVERQSIEQKIKNDIQKEKEDEINVLNKELNAKSKQVKELYKLKALLEQKEREKNELRDKVQAEAETRMNALLSAKQEEIRKQEFEKNELKNRELQKQLEDQKKLVSELQRKQEQGSIQLQGEIQELAIEECLRKQFPLDTVEEIKKGARGADCFQTVNSRDVQNCGTIYYESKRTKDFSNSWIEKFKSDMREKNANIGVLVTDVYPKDMNKMDLRDGIWICSYEEFKGLSIALRESLIQLKNFTLTQENRGDKMAMLYSYLTGIEFKSQIEAIVEGFVQLKTDLDTEKRAMARLWKEREKQIDKVITNTTNMYGSIKGIAGNAVQSIKSLELPESNNALASAED